jgi:hypothetical protein
MTTSPRPADAVDTLGKRLCAAFLFGRLPPPSDERRRPVSYTTPWDANPVAA